MSFQAEGHSRYRCISTDSGYVLPPGLHRRGSDFNLLDRLHYITDGGLVPTAGSAGLLTGLVASLQPLDLRLSCPRSVEEGHHLPGG